MSNRIDDGGPAFPKTHDPYPNVQQSMSDGHGGMSLRDWFAGNALQGFCAGTFWGECDNDEAAKAAYAVADAMLAARLPPESESTGG